jgi:hypothetical protein
MTTKISFGLLATTIVLLVLSLLLGQQIIYQGLIVPRLPQYQSVPMWWWLGVVGPYYLVCFLVGSKLRAWFEFFIYSIAATLVSQIYDFTAASLHQTGYLKSFAIESPLYFWTVGSFFNWLGVAIAFGIGMYLGRKLKLWETRNGAA